MLKKLSIKKGKISGLNAALKTAFARTFTGITVIFMASSSQPALASLIGDTVLGELNFGGGSINFFDPAFGFVPGGAGPQPFATVNDGVEFQFADFVSSINADLTADTLWVEQLGNSGTGVGSWNMSFEDLNWVDNPGRIVGLELLSEPDSNPFPGLSFSFTDDSINLSFSGGSLTNGGFSSHIQILTEHESESIPEPSFVLGLLTIGGLKLLMKRKN
ncbi:MAG: hypothetical protein WBA93_02060 [Microcoleaceae cyanobacterium]